MVRAAARRGTLPRRRALAAHALRRDLHGAEAGPGSRRSEPVRGVGLHGRLDQQPDRAAARDPQQRVRAARRHQPRRRQGAGQRARVHGHEHERSSRPTAARQVHGTFQVPCYLIVCGPTATAGFHYSSTQARRARRRRSPATSRPRSSSASIPATAAPLTPARVSLYGHGLLGCSRRGRGRQRRGDGDRAQHRVLRHRLVGPGRTDDTPGSTSRALQDLNQFPARRRPPPAGRAQHAVPRPADDQLRRARVEPGLPAAGQPVIDTAHLYYDGNSQGGIVGGMTTAVAPDFTPRRARRHRDGLRQRARPAQHRLRAVRHDPVRAATPTRSMHPVLLDLMQQLWDRGDPDGYAAADDHASAARHAAAHGADADRLRRPPGQHVRRRDRGADDRRLSATSRRSTSARPRTRHATCSTGSRRSRATRSRGSAIEIWDSGPGRVQPPPLADHATGSTGPTNIDPARGPAQRRSRAQQKSDFLQPNGEVVDVCGGAPCHSSDYTP